MTTRNQTSSILMKKSVFENLRLDPSWDIPIGTKIQTYHDLAASPLDETEIESLILSACQAKESPTRQEAHERLAARLGERYWGWHEHELVRRQFNQVSAQTDVLAEVYLEILRATPDLAATYNCLEQIRVFGHAVPTNLLRVMSCHYMLVGPCFDILLGQQGIAAEDKLDLCAHMMLRLRDHRKLVALRHLGFPVSKDLSLHILATPIQTVASAFLYTARDNIDFYLEFLRYGDLFETLRAGHPGEEIISNLIHTYAEIAEMLFEEWVEHADQAIQAFPLFVQHVQNTALSFDDLIQLNQVHENLVEFTEDEREPKHVDFWTAADELKSLFQEEKYRVPILAALEDVETPDYTDIVDVAVEHYGANMFDNYFKYAQHTSLEGFWFSFWLFNMTNGQREDLIKWVRSHLPQSVLSRPINRDQDYSKFQRRLLEQIISKSEYTLQTPKDQYDIMVWGLSSRDDVLASSAAWLLENLSPVSWPDGVTDILRNLAEATNPNTSSWKTKGSYYVKAKDRLSELIRVATPD